MIQLIGEDLEATFRQTREKQLLEILKPDTGPSALDRQMDDLMLAVSRLAIGDRMAGRDAVRVASAPTGTGKTMASLAFAAAAIMATPDLSVGIVVEYVDQANDLFEHLLKLLPKEHHGDVAVWTVAHDVKTNDEKAAKDYKFKPTRRFERAALDTARIAIGTHNRFLKALGAGRTDGLMYFRGERRSIVFVDETPAMVQLVETMPGDLFSFRDAVQKTQDDDPRVPVLSGIALRMEEALSAAKKGASFVPVDLVETDAEVEVFRSDTATSLQRYAKGPVEKRKEKGKQWADVIAFIRAARGGYVFHYAQQPARFVSYQLIFKPFPGLVVLDATSDLTGVRLLAKGLDTLQVPRVDYRHLQLNYVPLPREFDRNTATLMKKKADRDAYAEWMKATIIQNSSPGETVLMVTHKAMVDNEHVGNPPEKGNENHDPKKPWPLDDRQVLVMTWGSSIGANWAKDATAVFLFGEFHIPKAATVGTVLAIEGTPFRAARGIDKAQAGAKSGAYWSAQDDHLCRWAAQLGARGCMRKVDGSGVADPMRLYATMPLRRQLRLQAEMWGGAAPPRLPFGYQPERAQTTADRLAMRLAASDQDRLWYSELVAAGFKMKDLAKTLGHPDVAAVMAAYGWRPVTTTDAKGSHKALVRTPEYPRLATAPACPALAA